MTQKNKIHAAMIRLRVDSVLRLFNRTLNGRRLPDIIKCIGCLTQTSGSGISKRSDNF